MGTLLNPVKRNLRFHLQPDRLSHWSGRGPHFSQLLNTFSIFFPQGEKFFIDSVRNFQTQISDAELKSAIVSFMRQEALHSREHIEYNKVLQEAGYPVELFEAQVALILNLDRLLLPKEAQLAITCALEHLTAIMAQALLGHHEAFSENSDPRFVAMWKWHALEETEHKAVAFDVYREMMGKRPDAYAIRVMMYLISNLVFWGLVIPYHLSFLHKAGQQWNLASAAGMIQTLWGRPGAFRKIVPDWLAYFRPDFHPWDLDNRHFLSLFDSLIDQVEAFRPPAAETRK
ncbi:MAG: metal-dependent hydrolase [Candidatus Sericytochromatia bacterium]